MIFDKKVLKVLKLRLLRLSKSLKSLNFKTFKTFHFFQLTWPFLAVILHRCLQSYESLDGLLSQQKHFMVFQIKVEIRLPGRQLLSLIFDKKVLKVLKLRLLRLSQSLKSLNFKTFKTSHFFRLTSDPSLQWLSIGICKIMNHWMGSSVNKNIPWSFRLKIK